MEVSENRHRGTPSHHQFGQVASQRFPGIPGVGAGDGRWIFLAGPSRSPKAMVDVGHLMMFTFFWDHEMGVCLRGMGWDCLILL